MQRSSWVWFPATASKELAAGSDACLEQRCRADTTGVRACALLGYGNTAIDAARAAKALGIEDGTLLYRGTQAGMSGHAHEWEAAVLHGVRAQWSVMPTAFAGPRSVTGVQCVRTDHKEQAIAGSHFSQPADLVLLAIGRA